MDITKRFSNAIAAFRKNSITPKGAVTDGDLFRKFGVRRTMPSIWSTPDISDEDFYSGIGYAVINKRANRSVVLGKKFLFTDAKEEIIADANEKGVRVEHPYLKLIRDSLDFSERDFWYEISTYLDLEGIYYLMAVRTVARGGVGKIQKFELLNPYNVRRVVDSKGNLGGYVENVPGTNLQREIPKELIIPIKLLNPFDKDKSWSLADAARDAQFTMKQANDFSREAINGNLNTPGILSSAIELPDDQFDNFVDRVKNHGRGEPLFGNGAGTVHWEPMQTDLDKAALDKINSINRDALLAISGLSKTGIGVEESGTGREVSRTQKDDFTENAVMPQIENIIDALNLDYRKYYASQYQGNGYSISLDNPLETNRDAEQADVDIRDSQFTLMQSLMAKGYSFEISSKYAKGLVDITDIGEPTEEVDPVNPTTPPDGTPSGDGTDPNTPPTPDSNPANSYEDKSFELYEGYPVPLVQYLGENANQISALSENGSLIYSNESMLNMDAKRKTVRISHIAEANNSILGVVDETTFIKLGEFNHNADKVAILSKLNKRYKNQVVAIKKKLDLAHECKHDVYSKIKNAAFDKSEQVQSNTNDLLRAAADAENRLFDWYLAELAHGNNTPHANLESFINSMTLPFAVYFTVMFPIYASQRANEMATELDVGMPIISMTQEVKARINDFAKREATSHMNTIKMDIENALARVKIQTSDPAEQRRLFQSEFAKIQESRSLVIANNAAARIFNLSQYEADLQMLTRAGKMKEAYKELYSLTGDPCNICSFIINSTKGQPIPFQRAFAKIGDTIESDGTKMTFSYEDIEAGNVHPNCHCAYRLVIKDVTESSLRGGAISVNDSKLALI